MLTRRVFLKSSGALAVCAGAAPFARLGAQPLSRATSGKALVLIFLRGGCDGLNLVVPHGEARYYALRPWIAIPRPGQPNGAVDLDGFFGLHPRAVALQPFFASGTAVALHAVGSDHNTRSHFEEQDVWETGLLENTVSSDGWLNRHLQTSEGAGSIRAMSIGDSLPRVLRGKSEAIALRGLSDLSFTNDASRLPSITAALERAHAGGDGEDARGLLSRSARETLEALEDLQRLAAEPYESGVEYPNNDLGRRLREVARILKAGVGLEVCELDYGGWDTHQYQGGADGAFGNLTTTLAESVAAFCDDLGDKLDDVLVLTVSEFGRTAAQNGTGGTDHGWGGCMLALGGPVRAKSEGKARNVLGEWPGLEREQLQDERDLANTTDFRDVFAEVVKGHLGNPKLDVVLPDHQARPVGLI